MQDLRHILKSGDKVNVLKYGVCTVKWHTNHHYPLGVVDSNEHHYYLTKFGEDRLYNEICIVNPIDHPWPDAVPFPQPEPEFEHDEVIEVSSYPDFRSSYRRHYKERGQEGEYDVYPRGVSSLTFDGGETTFYRYARKLKQ